MVVLPGDRFDLVWKELLLVLSSLSSSSSFLKVFLGVEAEDTEE